jgi:hypothetical protein
MENFLSKFAKMPIPPQFLAIRPEVEEKINNFKAFLKSIMTQSPASSSVEQHLDAMLHSSGIEGDAPRLLFIFAKVVLPNIGRDEVERHLREKYGYDIVHKEKILRYLTYIELAYNDGLTF